MPYSLATRTCVDISSGCVIFCVGNVHLKPTSNFHIQYLNSTFIRCSLTPAQRVGTAFVLHKVQFPYFDAWKVFKECGEGGVGIRLGIVYDSANTTGSKTLITYVSLVMPAANVVAADIFGTGIVH
jgi:hypothetical protein